MSLPHASIHRARGHWLSRDACGTVTLDFDARHRRRIRMMTDGGEAILLNLPSAVALADGDGLGLDDGRWIAVKAADEPIVEVRHRDLQQLVRLAWHLGNRHLPVQIEERVLRIRPDHVILAMLEGLGADLRAVEAPFQPESGAYGHDGDQDGDHDHTIDAHHHHG